ncbi:MAG: GxxExxY protein [Magnetospirillum gryphiswaldense]|nr:GxxExxY protein [Magnetospirillum gryphiswaldense]
MNTTLPARMESLTESIIGAAFAVANELGHGFLETVYRNAMLEELTAIGLSAVKERSYPVYYRRKSMGVYCADIVVEECVIVELKAVDTLSPSHRAQLLNYLKASGLPIGLLLNFGTSKVQMRRVLNLSQVIP